ncbi:MAG: (4Fe-4S)-binding protein [Eggerthellaceae bacterium]|nr:(4Fe-4S)-binding protein [Eggerthellaceae bacterium]
MADYKFIHSQDRCVQCGLCIDFCPCYVLDWVDGYPAAVNPDACVGCTTCSGNCPQRAITIEAIGDASFNPFVDEERSEGIPKEKSDEYAKLERVIMEKLDLRWRPVAVSLIEKDELLPDVPMPPENLRFCQAMMAARRGASILMPPFRHSCPDGTSIFGMTDVPKKLATGEIYVLFHKVVSAEAAAQMVAERPTLPANSRRATYVAPLSKTVRDPEVVVITGTPEQMMWLCMSMSYYTGHRFDFHASGFNSMCVEAVLYPIMTDQPNITFGCYGCRAASDIGEDMMFMGIPTELLPTVASGLTELAKKAIPDSRNKIYVPPIM